MRSKLKAQCVRLSRQQFRTRRTSVFLLRRKKKRLPRPLHCLPWHPATVPRSGNRGVARIVNEEGAPNFFSFYLSDRLLQQRPWSEILRGCFSTQSTPCLCPLETFFQRTRPRASTVRRCTHTLEGPQTYGIILGTSHCATRAERTRQRTKKKDTLRYQAHRFFWRISRTVEEVQHGQE